MKSTRHLVATAEYAGKRIEVVAKKKGKMFQWGVLTCASPASPRRHCAYATAGSLNRAGKDAVKAAKKLFPGIRLDYK